MKNKLPPQILTLQSIILTSVPRELFDENGVWLHYRRLSFVNAAWSGWPFPGKVPKKKLEEELVLQAGILLAHLSDDKSCKKPNGGTRRIALTRHTGITFGRSIAG